MMALLLRKYWLPLLLVALGIVAVTTAYTKGKTAGKAQIQAQWDRARAEAAAAVAKAKDQDLDKGQQASVEYQERKAEDAAKIKVVRQTVVRTVSGPCLDADGLRHINAAIGAVPAASAAH